MNDKALLKAAGIIGIVFGVLSCLTIIGLIFGIPMIIGGFKLNSYSDLSDDEIINYKNSILGWSIFFVIFSLIAGILGLIYYFGISNDTKYSDNSSDYMDELEKLKKLYDDKVITKEEFESKKKKILDKI